MEKTFGKYRVLRELGQGGMGVVYLAHDPDLQREVAIKTISSGMADESIKERFIREARSAGKLHHSNIITIYDFGRQDQQLFIAMEYLDGRDLDEYIEDKIRLDIKVKLEIIRQICLGLDFAHQHDIYHRDVKPANIKVLSNGNVKIMDFGLAVMQTSSITRTGAVMGTPHYLAPELVRGHKASDKSDQFALGLILYELLTYHRSFSGDSIPTVLYKILNTEPQRLDPELTRRYPELEAIIGKSIMKDPEHRYGTLKEMADDLLALRDKMGKDSFSMDDTVEIIEEAMPTTVVDTGSIAGEHARNAGMRRFTPWLGFAALLAVMAFLYFFVITPSVDKPGSVSGPAGFLAFDVKPYAAIEKIVNLETGRKVPLAPNTQVTPVRLELRPGKYEITYTHPAWGDNKRIRVIVINTGETTYEKDVLDEAFVKQAVEHFCPRKGVTP